MTTREPRAEALLRAAASTMDWPPTPDLRGQVLARIAAATMATDAAAGAATALPVPALLARPGGRPTRRLSLVRALVLALLAALVLAGVAAALGYRLPGLDIVFVDQLPPAGAGLDHGSPVPLAGAGPDLGSPVPLAGAGLNLGSPVPLAGAREPGRPRVLLPAVLPEPKTAFVLGTGDRRIVTLAWRARDGEAVLPGSDLSLTLMAVPGDTDEGLLGKMLGPGTTIEPVHVGPDRGWWISGAHHELLISVPGGNIIPLAPALAGDTLVFVRDGTLYRLESSLGRDATVGIAASLR